jgi:hypothetical protein
MKHKLLISCIALLMSNSTLAFSADEDMTFFQKAQGKWAGPGEIIAGKYKGTKFNCAFDGVPTNTRIGVTMSGKCRIGVFTEEMKATIEKINGIYQGTFLDGAKGKGLDVTSGTVTNKRVMLTLLRNQLDGSMIAHMTSEDAMNVNISVRVNTHVVPVIGMTLTRISNAQETITQQYE